MLWIRRGHRPGRRTGHRDRGRPCRADSRWETLHGMADGLLATITEILAQRSASVARLLAEAVRRHCAVEHVALVSFQGVECSVLAAVGPELLAVGTTAPSALSTRLVRTLE